jgi:hypothetical protein
MTLAHSHPPLCLSLSLGLFTGLKKSEQQPLVAAYKAQMKPDEASSATDKYVSFDHQHGLLFAAVST